MSITLISVFFLAVFVIISLLMRGTAAPSLRVFSRLAPRYGGATRGRYLYPRLLFPLRGGQAQLSHQWSRRAAAGGQLIFRQRFLIFRVSAERLQRCIDLIIYSRIGWTSIVRQVSFERYITGDVAFDDKFVIFSRNTKDKVAALLDYNLRQKIMSLRELTDILEIVKVRQTFRIKYQKSKLESEQEVEGLLQRFLDIYGDFEDSATAG